MLEVDLSLDLRWCIWSLLYRRSGLCMLLDWTGTSSSNDSQAQQIDARLPAGLDLEGSNGVSIPTPISKQAWKRSDYCLQVAYEQQLMASLGWWFWPFGRSRC